MNAAVTLTRALGLLLVAAAPAAAGPGPDAGKPAPPPERTFRDPTTGLVWQLRGELPRAWSVIAKGYCRRLKHAGADDWRMPTIDELRSLVRGCKRTASRGRCRLRQRCSAEARCFSGNCRGCGKKATDRPDRCYWPAAFGKRCERVIWSCTTDRGRKVPVNWYLDFSTAGLIKGLWKRQVSSVFCVRGPDRRAQ
jgi:hypothetical protein